MRKRDPKAFRPRGFGRRTIQRPPQHVWPGRRSARRRSRRLKRAWNVRQKGRRMKQLYRLVIRGWWPVTLEETEAAAVLQSPRHLKALYEDCEVNPYDFDDLRVTLEPATEADRAK